MRREYALIQTPGKAVANFFTPLSKKEPEKMTWRIVKDSLLIGRYAASNVPSAAKGRTKIAAFDFVRSSVELHTAVV
jgi:bifunctional polynucleotide phosphatase/kinase